MMHGGGTDSQGLPSWIADFFEYTRELPSPELFRKWAAVAAIAGVLERRVWVRSHDNLYPNFYIILTGPPGVGKTVLTSLVYRMWAEVPDHKHAPSSVSRASLIDCLADAKRSIIDKTGPIEYNALGVVSNELGNFIPAWDSEFMSVLTDLYDGHAYNERKRGKDLRVTIPHPCLNLLGATTPSWLLTTMPVGAWDQGFTSRTLFVYSGDKRITDIFGGAQFDGAMYKSLTDRLTKMSQMWGEMRWEPAAADALRQWHFAGGPPTPDHPKLTHYLTRRTAHLMKLCVVCAAADHDELVINLVDYHRALDLLCEMEAALPDVFKSMVAGGDSAIMEELHYFLYTLFMKEGKKPVSEHRLIAFLRERTPSHNIMRVIDVMVRSGMIKAEIVSGLNHYRPLEKTRII